MDPLDKPRRADVTPAAPQTAGGEAAETEEAPKEPGERQDLSKDTAEDLKVEDLLDKSIPSKLADEVEKVAEEKGCKGELVSFLVAILRMGGNLADMVTNFVPSSFQKKLDTHEKLKDETLSENEQNEIKKGEIKDPKLTDSDKEKLKELHFQKAYTQVACNLLGIKEVENPLVLAARLKHSSEKDNKHYQESSFEEIKANGMAKGTVLMRVKGDPSDPFRVQEKFGYMVFVAINKEEYRGYDPESGGIKTFNIKDKESPINIHDMANIPLAMAFVPTFITDVEYSRQNADKINPEIDKSEIALKLKKTDDLMNPILGVMENFESELGDTPDSSSISRILKSFELLKNIVELDKNFEENKMYKEFFTSRYKEKKEQFENGAKILNDLALYMEKYVNSEALKKGEHIEGSSPSGNPETLAADYEKNINNLRNYISNFDRVKKFLYTAEDKK